MRLTCVAFPRAIEYDLKLNYTNRLRWTNTKKAVTSRVSADMFAARHMDPETVDYCVNDLLHLPALLNVYSPRLKGNWPAKIKDATARRLQQACAIVYEPNSEQKKYGPWGY